MSTISVNRDLCFCAFSIFSATHFWHSTYHHTCADRKVFFFGQIQFYGSVCLSIWPGCLHVPTFREAHANKLPVPLFPACIIRRVSLSMEIFSLPSIKTPSFLCSNSHSKYRKDLYLTSFRFSSSCLIYAISF